MRKLCIIVICLCLFVATSQAYWTGGGDGTSFGDVDNWTETVVPLTSGGATTTTINANAAVTTVNLDAATADTLVDGTNTNFLSTRAQTAGQTLNFNADWGNGYTNAAMWAGQSTAGTVNFNSNAGTLTTTSGSYIGRSSLAGSTVNFNVNGGTVGFKQVYIGALSDSLGDLTLNVNAGTVYLGQSDSIANGGILGRIQSGAYASGQTTKVAIGGDATVVAYDWRIGSLGGGLGTDMLEITGSNATITCDHNFYTCQQGTYLGPCIVKFVADANGVSPIRSYDDGAVFRIAAATELIVDVNDYTGYEDLLLVDFGPNKLSGSYLTDGTVTIIGGTADLLEDYANGDIYLTNIDSVSNQAPAVDAGADKQTWLDAGTAAISLDDAAVVDLDGPGALSQQWSVITGPGTVTFSPDEFTVNPNVTFTVAGVYELQLEANDTAAIMTNTVQVTVYPDVCEYAKVQPGYVLFSGDINEDCIVNLLDFSVLASQWLQSQ